MNESSIFYKEEELLEFGRRFLAEYGPDSTATGEILDNSWNDQDERVFFYQAFQRVFDQYNKLFQQTTRMIRLSDRTQLRLDTVNKSLRESQLQLERRNQFIRSIFSRYMSDEVVESILETPEGLQMGGEKKQVTVLMSDLRGFTGISETLPPETVVAIINQYLEKMTEIIFKYRGTISNFMGDGIMVLFGAPILRDDDAQRAVACALEMQQAMPEINVQNQAQGYPELSMGIGIHTGTVVAGNVGSQKRSQYTVMGRAVNLAARIESYSVGGQVLISERTKQACSVPMRIDNSMEVMPKGVEQPLTLYHVGGIGGAYSIYLGEAKAVEYLDVDENFPVQFSVLAGKHTGEIEHVGTFCALSPGGAKLVTTVPIEPFTNLKLTVQRQDGTIHGIFAKVVNGKQGEDNVVELVFTFLPAKAKTLFQTLLKGDGRGKEADEALLDIVMADLSTTVPLKTDTQSNKQEARGSFRRVAAEKPLPIQMEDGSRFQVIVCDYCLDGMFLKMNDATQPEQGAKGSLELPFHGHLHRFPFYVVRTCQEGIGVQIIGDQKQYAIALLDGALGDFMTSDA